MASTKERAGTPDPWITLGAAGRRLRESRLSVLTRIVKGELTGQHVGGQTFVLRETVDALAGPAKRGKSA